MQECKMFFSKNKFDYGYLIEEYITGYDVGCNVLCDKGVILAHTIQKGNLFEQAPFSPQIGLDFFATNERLTGKIQLSTRFYPLESRMILTITNDLKQAAVLLH